MEGFCAGGQEEPMGHRGHRGSCAAAAGWRGPRQVLGYGALAVGSGRRRLLVRDAAVRT